MTAVERGAWKTVAAVNFVALFLFISCVVSQNAKQAPPWLGRLAFDFGGYIVFAFVWSGLALFVLSLFFWRRLSEFQRTLGVGITVLTLVLFLLLLSGTP